MSKQQPPNKNEGKLKAMAKNQSFFPKDPRVYRDARFSGVVHRRGTVGYNRQQGEFWCAAVS